eukprot:3987514-Heterocapsa_arctica.AAC.1
MKGRVESHLGDDKPTSNFTMRDGTTEEYSAASCHQASKPFLPETRRTIAKPLPRQTCTSSVYKNCD